MKDSLTQRAQIDEWARAGDPSAMLKLAELYLSEGKTDEAKNFLKQSAEKNFRPAVMTLAKLFDEEKNLPQAVNFYKQAAELKDVAAMERLVELCPSDEKILNFVLEIIDKQYNEIYFMGNIIGQTMVFGSGRLSEYLPGQAKAIERRRIKNKILKLKAAKEDLT